jgi:hypothetical protein
MKILISGVAPEIPRWMYYVRAVILIVCSVIDLFLLPFGHTCNLPTIWQGRMLRSVRRYRQELEADEIVPIFSPTPARPGHAGHHHRSCRVTLYFALDLEMPNETVTVIRTRAADGDRNHWGKKYAGRWGRMR